MAARVSSRLTVSALEMPTPVCLAPAAAPAIVTDCMSELLETSTPRDCGPVLPIVVTATPSPSSAMLLLVNTLTANAPATAVSPWEAAPAMASV
ncbi:hypothetical protein Y695_04396 [Hydrogenophaga sp. T4]|nr:hypothetical protein Y695_04396 [Hydrogenophaga sp. T4]